MVAQRNRNFRLAEEIGDQLGRIVAAGIFEVEEDHPAGLVGQRVVKAEIGRRQAAFIGAQRAADLKPGVARVVGQARLHRVPFRQQRGRPQGVAPAAHAAHRDRGSPSRATRRSTVAM